MFFAESVLNILKTISLYYLESGFKSVPNKQHYNSTHAKFHVFGEIHNDSIKKRFSDIFTSFHPKSPQNLRSQTLFRVRNIFMFNIILYMNRQKKFANCCAVFKLITLRVISNYKNACFLLCLVKTT